MKITQNIFFPNLLKKMLVFALVFSSIYSTVNIGNVLATGTPSFSNECVVVEEKGDNVVEEVQPSTKPEIAPSLSTLITNAGLSVGDQKQYQVWQTNKESTTVQITFLGGSTIAGNVFGYYLKDQPNTFVPLFVNGGELGPEYPDPSVNSVYPNAVTSTVGQVYTVVLPAGEIAFAINSDLNGIHFRASENNLNTNGGDYMVAYDVVNSNDPNYGSYVLGFEDVDLEGVSDKDYNDTVVKVDIKNCETACVENAELTITQDLPETIVGGETYTFKVNAYNSRDTKWYHGSYFQLINTAGDIEINPTYGHLPRYIYPGDNVEWSFEITATTTPGEHSVTLQMVHRAGAEYKDANFQDCAPAPTTDVLFGNPITVTTEVPTPVEPKYCADGETLTISEFKNALDLGLIDYNLAVHGDSYATFTINNQTECKAPISLSSYKMFDTVLSHQQLFDGTGLVNATSTTVLVVDLPSCMAQIDAWYGLHPTTLNDSNPYQYPNVPWVLTYKFIQNTGSGYSNAEGNFCTKPTVNTAPVITLIGANPLTITEGSTFTDPGATADDLEDGDITADIVVAGTVDTNTLGTTTLAYNVVDSEGLSATEVTRTVVIVPVPVNPPLTLVATKIVCDAETDLPNYGSGGPDISSTTATDFISAHPNCHLESGWNFQWSFEGETGKIKAPILDGDFVGEATTTPEYSSWNIFGSTDSNGVATTTISDFNDAGRIWVREVLKDGYIPFSYPTGSDTDVSAEIYCHKDTLNYDNYDFISPISLGETYYCVAWNVAKAVTPVNTPPVLTLVGENPIDIYVGDTYTDPGATADDLEDGDITADIVVTGTVDNTLAGAYTLTYNVTDSGGLSATPVSRTVNVLNPIPSTKGSIRFCLLIGDENNVLATSTNGLPSGSFAIDLATSTSFGTTTINSKSWDTNTFSPNTMTILSEDDSECVIVNNLEMGDYYYSELSINGSLWNTPKYSDQHNQPVNNIFDLFLYSPELFNSTTTDDSLRNVNSDGHIVLDSSRKDRTVVIYSKYSPAPQCVLPSITSAFTASGVVGQQFTYTMTASSTVATTTLGVATSTLPAWLSFNTASSTLEGTPTSAGTFDITMEAVNTCGTDTQTLTITVTNPQTNTPEANLEVVKTSDKSTANTEDTVTYTIVVTNNGADNATGVKVIDTLSSNLTFVSATSTLGSYSTTTGEWIIGSLNNTASTTLTIVATINGGTEGQSIANTAVVSATENDPDGSNNTSTVDVSVNNPNPPTNPPACTSNCGGGGGGGGGGPIYPNNLEIFNESVIETAPGIAFVTWNTNLSATRRVVYGTASNPVVGSAPNYGYTDSTELVETPLLTAHAMAIAIEFGQTYYFRPISTDINNGVVRTVIGKEVMITRGTTPTEPTSCYYLLDYLRKDFNNNPVEVKKLQVFLRDLEGFTDIVVTGVYDDQTINYLNQFQARYAGDILTPWGHTAPTSYTYILTKKKVNEIYCQRAFPVTPLQQEEIDSYRAFLLGLQSSGISVPPGGFTTPIEPSNPVIQNNVVGSTNTGSSTTTNGGLTTLAGISSTTENLLANVISSGRRMMDYVSAIFAWPFGSIFTSDEQCKLGGGWFNWVNLILVLVIAYVSYRWYQERKNNKRLDEINKEIDLE